MVVLSGLVAVTVVVVNVFVEGRSILAVSVWLTSNCYRLVGRTEEGNNTNLRMVKKCFSLVILIFNGHSRIKDIFLSKLVQSIFTERNVCPAPIESHIDLSSVILSCSKICTQAVNKYIH